MWADNLRHQRSDKIRLELPALKESLTLVVETNRDSRQAGCRPTLFCLVEWCGEHMMLVGGKGREPKELYEQAVARFGFTDPYKGEDEA